MREKENYNNTLKKNADKNRTTRYNILIVVKEIDFGDVARNIVDFANYCVNNDIGVIIATGSANIKFFLDKRVDIIIDKRFLQENFLLLKSYANKLKKICSISNIDIILSYSILLSWVCKTVSRSLKIPYIDIVSDIFHIKSKFDYYKMSVITKSNKIIVMSEYIRDYIIKTFPMKNMHNIKLVVNGIDLELFDHENITNGRIEETLKQIDVNIKSKKILVFPSKYVEKKGHKELLRAISQIKNNDFVVVFSGDFKNTKPFRDELFVEAKKLNVDKIIRICNKIDDMPSLYLLSYATLYLPQVDEGISRIPYESLAMKRPVIATINGCINYSVINNKTGFLVRKNSINDIKLAIEKILKLDDEKYKEFGENGYLYANKYFNKERSVKEIENIVSQIIEDKE